MLGLNFKKSKQLDFVGVGDAVTDTFIELMDAWIENDNPQKTRELCMRFGDKIPYKNEVIVHCTGNAMNATHAAMKLGLTTGVITNIGDDDNGTEMLVTLTQKGIDITNVTSHLKTVTNHNYILRYKEDRTILIQHNDYKYSFPKFEKRLGPKWIYLSSLSHDSIPYHLEIVDFLNEPPETK